MGIRDQLRSLKRQANEELDYLILKDGSRYYFDPQRDSAELFFETIQKGYKSSSEEVETPGIRQALVRATPESLARFEEKYQLSVTQEINLVGFPDKDQSIVRRVELDGRVRSFLLSGSAAQERLAASRAGHREREPLDLGREDIREIPPEEEAELLAVPDQSQ